MRLVAVIALAALMLAGAAAASWQPTGAGAGGAKGKSMPTTAPSAPTATAPLGSHSVTVTWTASSFLEGGTVPTYRVLRYNALNVVTPAGPGCSDPVSGLSCVETNVPTGTWTYTVMPVAGSWQNAHTESAKSSTVIIGP